MRAWVLGVVLALMAGGAQAEVRVVCTLVAEAETGRVVLEEGACAARETPASTFKVALAVIGFEAGFLQDAHAPVLEYRKGEPDWGGKNWTRDTTPERWMTYSVVWYSQRIARALGAEVLSAKARALGYGNADFAGDAGYDNGLERAWISSSLQISPREQVAFLRGLVTGRLPVSARAMRLTRAVVEERRVGGWRVNGKTGGAYPRRADRSFDYAAGVGWFVGWAEKDGRVYVFARLTRANTRLKGSPGVVTRARFLENWPAMAERLR
ncbi:class D beta-lactamase [Rhodobacteraceae bacterium D3-12]|nr:class D beta-lactamase [Rhodobacteraceae bacterium D3-12]